MNLSDDVKAIVELLNSQNSLRKRNDIGILLECGAANDLASEINALASLGKALWSLFSLLRKMSQNDEGYKRIEQEFSETSNKMREQLLGFFAYMGVVEQERFDTTYLRLTQGTIRNIVDLSHDLAGLKNLQNDAKRGSSQ